MRTSLLKRTFDLIVGITLVVLIAASFAAGQTSRHKRKSAGARRHPSSSTRKAGGASEFNKLIEQLRAKGAVVKHEEDVSQPFFSVKGRVLLVNGEAVQVFEFRNAAVAEAEARRVNSAGTTIGTSSVSWMAPPHFYRKGNLIALYVGVDPKVMSALEAVLGAQFAGSQ
jgi:hypothetical protein